MEIIRNIKNQEQGVGWIITMENAAANAEIWLWMQNLIAAEHGKNVHTKT